MKFINCLLAVLVASSMFITPAFANYACRGEVKGVTISPDGQVFVASIGTLSWPRLCSVAITENNVPPEACKVIYSALLTAQTTGKEVSLSFNDSGDCNSHTAWGWLTGWYFGPVLD
ncbi:hypothetical protein Sps_03020 [Shewanella psychrophila]|uniref:Uncharacterized protein n=1 Tax=Shewanella psychrophila TaxID=225848 RepID=A0A1S6HRJ1_9GAMM|nr:hypothetical protein [Shewanella psychrophila]AQS38167.1 hypothetical protein Sps_03020 [Shewanella psychrophila]